MKPYKEAKTRLLLAALPDDADSIARFLELQGVRGERGEASRCALAVYLKRNGVPRIEVSQHHGVWPAWGKEWEVGSTWHVPLSPACKDFVERFDVGQYERLVKGW